MSRNVEQAQSMLEKQIAILDSLRNATTRAQEFREWRQHTLTMIERLWPEQAARAQRFRRVPFSPASARADERAMREAFERGCAEARRLLQLWHAEIATHGLDHEAEAPRLAEAVRATLSEAMPDSESLDLAPIGDVGLDEDGADDADAPEVAPPPPPPAARAGLPPRPPRPGITPVPAPRPAAPSPRPSPARGPSATSGQRSPAPPGQRPAAPQAQRPAAPQAQRPTAPPAQRPTAPQGQRSPISPQGPRPMAPQGPRPAAPQGPRPAASQGQRPNTPQGQRPQAAPPRPPAPPAQRPMAPQAQRPAVGPQGQRPATPPQRPAPPSARAAEPPRRDRDRAKGKPPLKEMLGFERPLPGDDDDMGMPEFDATFRQSGSPSSPAPPPAKPASSRPAMAPTPGTPETEPDDDALRRMLELEIEALESRSFDDRDDPDDGSGDGDDDEYADDAVADDAEPYDDDADAADAHEPPLEIENNSFLRHTTDSTATPQAPRTEGEFRPLDGERVAPERVTPPARPAATSRPTAPTGASGSPPRPATHVTPSPSRPPQPAAPARPVASAPPARAATPPPTRPATTPQPSAGANRPATPPATPVSPAATRAPSPPARPAAPAARPSAPAAKAPAPPPRTPAAPAPPARLEVERFERPELTTKSRKQPDPVEARDASFEAGGDGDALADALGAALERARHGVPEDDGSDHFAGEDFGPDDAADDLGLGDPHMVSYVARTFIGLAADVDELDIPEAHRERVRLALLDLAHYLDTGNVTWAILRDAITLVMHYPALARQALPLLLPFLETAA